MKSVLRWFAGLIMGFLLMFAATGELSANEGVVLGVHILEVDEVGRAAEFVGSESDYWSYVTVPIRLDQLDQLRWQRFFDEAERKRLIPIVRLVTEFSDESWRVPSRANVVEYAEFLSSLEWPSDKRHVVLFNEPNHAGEWGGRINPESYAQVISFAADWFHTESESYVVLPAGLDAAAGNTSNTMESFLFMERMFTHDPGLIEKFDGWTAHGYANPGFSGSAYSTAKNGLLSWQYELDYIKRFSDKELPVYITETGWDQSRVSKSNLVEYYTHALSSVWNDERVAAVTPFILSGNGGMFDAFSFYYPDGSPTVQMEALELARARLRESS